MGESHLYSRQRKVLNLFAKFLFRFCRGNKYKVKKGLMDSLYLFLASSSSTHNACEEVFSNPHVCNVTASKPILPQVGSIEELLKNCQTLKPGTISESDEKVRMNF